MNLPVSLVCIAVLLVTSCCGEVIRMKISTQQTKPWAPWRRIVAPLKVDTQDLNAVIDTGSPYTHLVWKKWYESFPQNKCDDFFYKCYDCNPSQMELKAAKKITFVDKTSLTVFPYAGDFYFYGVTAEDIDFGVVNDASHGAWAALGLGPQATSPSFPRFVDQLVDAELIDSPVFAVYLSAGNSPSGELIIGGDDPSKYEGPLGYMDVVDKQLYTNKLEAFAIGSESQKDPEPVVFDTGSSFVSIPRRLRSQVLDLLSTAGTKKVEVFEQGDIYGVDCKDVDYLPTMSFTVKGMPGKADVTIAVPPKAYIVTPEPDVCILYMDFDDRWILGLPAFVGHYYSFDWVGARIGVAKAKE
ncbi:hypothetical protein FOZ60_017306 [Perkinsus olseni]|uniref:Peptidase A1 domain-containing protein n=2 Tax=Perkinsus olseni TaxID=32597 RepID=A0A7J6N0T9_PEROL|nr:hypothetical protein FOZ60_017306 [Perkinsus olseni]